MGRIVSEMCLKECCVCAKAGKRKTAISQRSCNAAFYPQDPVLVRNNRNRPQDGAPRIGLGPMSGLMTAFQSHCLKAQPLIRTRTVDEGEVNIKGRRFPHDQHHESRR
jgi:hypothetical protein